MKRSREKRALGEGGEKEKETEEKETKVEKGLTTKTERSGRPSN